MRAWSEPTAGRGASPLGEERIARGHGRHEPAGRGASPVGQERIAGFESVLVFVRYRTDVIRALTSVPEVQEAQFAETVKS